MTTKKAPAKKTSKRYGSTYKASTKRYANTTLYRTTATNRKAPNSAGVRESVMTVKYRSVPNKAPAKKTSTGKAKTPAKKAAGTARKPSTTKPKTDAGRIYRKMNDLSGRQRDYYLAGAGLKPHSPVPMSRTTEHPADEILKEAVKSWNRGVEDRNDQFFQMTKRPEEKKAWPTLAGQRAGDVKGRMMWKLSFRSGIDDKLSLHKVADFRDRRLGNIDKESEKAVHAQVKVIRLGTGAKSWEYVWLPKSVVQIR